MARYTGPKHRIARREGVNVLEKVSPSLDRRLNVPPGVHGRKGRRRKLSEYGIQLREKQKLKSIYGILEKQFKKYVDQAQKVKGNTEEALMQLLETRLDNIVYRFGFAKSRPQARQLAGHGHVLVNNRRVNTPSYKVNQGDVITLSSKILAVWKANKQEEQEASLPSYLDKKGEVGKVLRLPAKEDVANPVDYQLVIEYYSR